MAISKPYHTDEDREKYEKEYERIFRKLPKYYVTRHHNYWPYDFGGELDEAEIVFTWYEDPRAIANWKGMGKRVVSYEHGFGAYYGYKQVDVQPASEKYLSNGEVGKRTLMELGVEEDKILVMGHAKFEDIKPTEHKGNKALYVAQHWMTDVKEYNQNTFLQLEKAYPEYEWTVRVVDKSGGIEAGNVWSGAVEDIDLFEDIKKNLPKFDAVFTPRYATFCVFAELMGIPVYITDENLSFAAGGPGYVVPNNQNFIKIGDKLPEPKESNLEEYIGKESLPLEEVLEWSLK